MPMILLFTGKGPGIKTIKQLALDISSHSSPAAKLFFLVCGYVSRKRRSRQEPMRAHGFLSAMSVAGDHHA